MKTLLLTIGFGLLILDGAVAQAAPLAAKNEIPYKQKASDPGCVVTLTVKYRSVSHRDQAVTRVLYSFGELALERENGDNPLPAVGVTIALYDLFVLNFARDCRDRLKWARVMVNDYHGRFPDDADLEIATDRRLPERFLEDADFMRVKPTYSTTECAVSFRSNEKDYRRRDGTWGRLFLAVKDVRTLRADLSYEVLLLTDKTGRNWAVVFVDECEKKYELLRELLNRHAVMFPNEKGFTIDPVGTPLPFAVTRGPNILFRDTREGIDAYLPPRHDVK